MTALGKLLRTTAFQLTLVYLLIFVLFAVTLLGFATDPQDPAESSSEGVRIVRVSTGASRLPMIYSDPNRPNALPLPDPLVSRAIRNELSRNRFDVVHAHNWIVNSALGPAARARVPLVRGVRRGLRPGGDGHLRRLCGWLRLRVCPGHHADADTGPLGRTEP